MIRSPLRLLLAASAAGVLSCAWGSSAFAPASGAAAQGQVKPAAPYLRAIVYRPRDTGEVLILQPVYHGPQQEFCWVIPVPDKPSHDSVFHASQDFVDAVFARTAPTVTEEIIDPSSAAPGPEAQAAEGQGHAAGAGGASDWLAMGSYRINIPSRRDCARLGSWLKWTGYDPPAGMDAAAAPYVERGWRFVVVRAIPRLVSPEPVSGLLRPLGIRFGTAKATLPLGLGRLSARQATAVHLIVLAAAPVTCDTLKTVDLRSRASLEPGETYESYRARLASGTMVREAVVKGVCAYSDLHYDSRWWAGIADPPWQRFWATRFFGLLGPEHLLDLQFTAEETQRPFKVLVSREANLPAVRGTLRISETTRTGLMLLLLAVAAAVVWLFRLSADHGPRGAAAPAPGAFVGRSLLYAGGLLLLSLVPLGLTRELHGIRQARLFISGQMDLPQAILWSALLAVWGLATIQFVLRLRRAEPGARWVYRVVAVTAWAALMAAVVVFPSATMRAAAGFGNSVALGVAQAGVVLAITGLSVLLAGMAQLGVSGGRGQRVAAEFCLLLAVALLFGPAIYQRRPAVEGRSERVAHAEKGMAEEQGSLRQAVSDFRAAVGAYPKDLGTLAGAKPPSEGLDPAGNIVPIKVKRDWKPLLAQVPRDPLTRRPDWIYSPLLSGLVGSAAFSTEVSGPEQSAGQSPDLTPYWQLPTTDELRAALGPVAPMIWGEGDALLRMDAQGDGSTIARAVAIRRLEASILRIGQVAGIEAPLLAAMPGGSSHLILSCVISTKPRAAALEPALERSAVFEVSGAGHEITPRSSPIAGRVVRLEPSPDGLQIACILEVKEAGGTSRRLWTIGEDGEWQGPLAEGVARVAWHPTAGCVYALTALDGKPRSPQTKGRCRLVRVWPDGRTDTMLGGRAVSGDLLAANLRSVFVLLPDGKLQRLDIRKERLEPLDTGEGRVIDLLCLPADASAALLKQQGSGDEGKQRDRVVLFDQRGRRTEEIAPVAPRGARWVDGRILGQHEATGYLFVHVWAGVPDGGQVFLTGPDDTPPQTVPVVR